MLRVFPEQLPKTVQRFFDEWKSQKKTIEKMREHGAGPSFEDILKNASVIGDIRVITMIKEDADKIDFEDMNSIGRKVYEQKRVICILGINFQGPKIILARSKDLDINCVDLAK